MELVDVSDELDYRNEIAPGGCDIHSPNIPAPALGQSGLWAEKPPLA